MKNTETKSIKTENKTKSMEIEWEWKIKQKENWSNEKCKTRKWKLRKWEIWSWKISAREKLADLFYQYPNGTDHETSFALGIFSIGAKRKQTQTLLLSRATFFPKKLFRVLTIIKTEVGS